jgi:S-adenosylmethionine:tRNA ribosyltransferase-isomerase
MGPHVRKIPPPLCAMRAAKPNSSSSPVVAKTPYAPSTVMRSMESSVSADAHLKPFEGWTNKFIFPPYDFSIANCMITNFHTPKSTLMMMTSAFAGHDLLKKAYEEAIKEGYKFYSYGDAMLIL